MAPRARAAVLGMSDQRRYLLLGIEGLWQDDLVVVNHLKQN
jgi:hypothetical protein